MTKGEEPKVNILSKDFKPLFDGKSYDSAYSEYNDGWLLMTTGGRQNPRFHYLDIKNNREAVNLPKGVIGAHPFSEGIAIVCTRKKAIAIDITGKVVFEKDYKRLYDSEGEVHMYGDSDTGTVGLGIFGKYSDGVAPLTPDGIHWGYVDKTGEYVVKPIFEMVYNLKGGYGVVLFEGRWGILCF